ncbi:MAG: RDD family protein [Desulfobacteraceae bacterium]|nr:RDD family protein [Desulfobacteraceae bacterium]
MTWFCKDEEGEKGPFTKDELQNLVYEKTINAQTLIRNENENDWRPLKEFAHTNTKPDDPEQSVESGEQFELNEQTSINKPIDNRETETDALRVCSQCRRSFPEDQVVTFDDQIICSDCKPAFVQRVKEGAGITTLLKYAGFWVRFGAKFIDGIILLVIQWLILIPLFMSGFGSITGNPAEIASDSKSFMLIAIQQLIGITMPAIYTTFFLGRFAATPGKMACGLKVVAPDGGKISYLRALGRNFAEWISAIIFFIGYIMAGFDTEKRAMHDRICSTRVVHK